MSDIFALPHQSRQLRRHQARALERLRASLAAGKRRPMLMMPTGAGKTLTAAHIIQGARAKGNAVIFTVPALSLIDQTVAAFEAEGIDCIGVMQGSHPRTDPDQPIQICSVQTLARRKTPGAAIVIVDEAHQMHKSILKWMADPSWARVPFIGLSATPWARGLGKHYDDLIIATTTQELIDAGYLSPFVVYAPAVPDLTAVKTVAGDYDEGQLADAMDEPKLVGDVIEHWLKHGENRSTLVYGVNRAHAEHLQQWFVEAGIAAEYMDGLTTREDREATFVRFRAGETRIIANVGVLTTGVDLDVRCIIDCKPTKSEMLFVQTIGRGLRTAEGKDKLLVLDHAGNTLRLGLVTDIHHDRLDDGEQRKSVTEKQGEKSEPLPVSCEECKTVLRPRTKICEQCGHVRIAKAGFVYDDGELVRLGSRPKPSIVPTSTEKVQFHRELRWYAREKGYSPGWVCHKFREKFGHGPDGFTWGEPGRPSIKTQNWIRSRQIAYLKGRVRG
jgi:DNA repair protein RadD